MNICDFSVNLSFNLKKASKLDWIFFLGSRDWHMLELAWTTFSKRYVMLHVLYTLNLINMSLKLAYKCINLKKYFLEVKRLNQLLYAITRSENVCGPMPSMY